MAVLNVNWSIVSCYYFAGQNNHLLISTLIKHLDQKAVLKQPDMQLNIVEVTTSLVKHSRSQTSVALVTSISDLVRHLRRTMQCALCNVDLGDDIIKRNNEFRAALDDCLVLLCKKVCVFPWSLRSILLIGISWTHHTQRKHFWRNMVA